VYEPYSTADAYERDDYKHPDYLDRVLDNNADATADTVGTE